MRDENSTQHDVFATVIIWIVSFDSSGGNEIETNVYIR